MTKHTTLLLSFLFLIIFQSQVISCTEDGKQGIMPEHDQKIPLNFKSLLKSNITEEKFHEITDKIAQLYRQEISSYEYQNKKIQLDVQKDWSDSTINAYAKREQATWIIKMYGGLARHPAVTEDGFALVVCHELGHHIGGAPKKVAFFSSWATNEGQADYWATLKCLRNYFIEESNTPEILAKLTIPQIVQDSCAAQFEGQVDQQLCQRSTMAGYSVANLFKNISRQTAELSVSTPDLKAVTTTYHDHPSTQCRLDTYFQGALCLSSLSEDVSQEDPDKGTCNTANNDSIGLRPACWYKEAIN